MVAIKKEKVSADDLKVKRPKVKKPKEPKDLRSVFRRHLRALEIEKLKKDWMAHRAFRNITNEADLEAWVDGILADKSRWLEAIPGKDPLPVIAVDTETIGLDTRIIVDLQQNQETGMWEPIYEVNIELAGVCLSADGYEGIYIPVNHEKGSWVPPTYKANESGEQVVDKPGYWTPAINVPREAVARALQRLFDVSHLVFYNAKFDREVMRLTLGVNFRGYPYYEDVQVINYINDPKADLGDKKKKQWTGDSGGLKALSKNILGMEQIEMDQLTKIKAEYWDAEKNKMTQRVQHAPFTWVPTDIALWYAAADAICTWLLWKKLKDLARSRKLIHRVDHELIESLTWIERQRFLIDTDAKVRLVKFHGKKVAELEEELRQIAVEMGWKEETDAEGNVLESSRFSASSNPQVVKLLFKICGLKVVKQTPKGGISVDNEAVSDLMKLYPEHKFLKAFTKYKEYVALHPESLTEDPRDKSARIYLKQCVVAGGRLAASGGDFPVDGGFGLNPQGIVRVEGNWWVKGDVLDPDWINPDDVEEHQECELHPSCFKDGKKAPGIIKNHIANYIGYAICLVPGCKTCAEKHGVLIPASKGGRLDANEVINMRALFVAPKGWTFFTSDYSNIEVRACANVTGEPELIKIFLEGDGDHHALTASKVFPEYNDPHIDKATKKKLRSRAKIINFALQYGGTEYTIFENMRKEIPDITWEKCQQMVADYKAGVPKYQEWCLMKQQIAREQMICTTATGRVIGFESAMKALNIRKPLPAEKENYYKYRDFIKRYEAALEEKNEEKAAHWKTQADILWKNPDTGVRNYKDYNQFMGKIQRVAVNVPLQGLAGDFMRIALNRIRRWAVEQEPLVQAVLMLHSSVHDEVDYSIKNEYVPFVVPRITRHMKLRKYHQQMNWPVPIECDTEFGHSWDLTYHLTGDDGHKPSGWTDIEGLELYIPDEFDMDTVKALLKAIQSGEEKRVRKAENWLKEGLHPRAFEAAWHVFWKKDKDNNTVPQDDKKAMKKQLIAALQLHEYWTIDNTPDGEDDKLETLEQYEARMGLEPKDRGFVPSFGYLGAIPLNERIKRPTVPLLGEDVPVEDVTITVGPESLKVEAPKSKVKKAEKVEAQETLFSDTAFAEEVDEEEAHDLYVATTDPMDSKVHPVDLTPEDTKVLVEAIQNPSEPNEAMKAAAARYKEQVSCANGDASEEDVLLDTPMPRRKATATPAGTTEATVATVAPTTPKVHKEELPDLAELDQESALRLREVLGVGMNAISVRYLGRKLTIRDVKLTAIPEEFLK